MATLAEVLGAQQNPSINVAGNIQEGVQAGIQLATAKEQVEAKKAQTEAMKAELISKQASTANSLLTNLARANPVVAKQMLKGVREKLLNLGVDPNVADYTVSDDAARQRQIGFSQFAAGKLTSDPKFAGEYFNSLSDLVGYDQAAQMFDNELKRRQQDKQFAIQESRIAQSQKKQDSLIQKQLDAATRQETQALSKRLEADSLPEVVSSIKAIDTELGGLYNPDAAKTLDQIAGSSGFAASLKIPFTEIAPLESSAIPDSLKPLYQNIASLRNNYLKLRSGGAVTSPEADRFLQELGQGNIRSGQQLQTGLQLLTDAINTKVKTIESGFSPESVNILAERGNIVSSKAIPSRETGGITAQDKAFIKNAVAAGATEAQAMEFLKSKKSQVKK